MKYYLLNVLDRIKQHSLQLDAEAILYNKKWVVFNDAGDKQVFIFRPDKELVISHNGEVTRSKWELLPDGTMIVDVKDQSFLLNPNFVDGQFLSLNLDGHKDSLLMLDSNLYQVNDFKSLSDVNGYLEEKYILVPKREEEKRLLAEKQEKDRMAEKKQKEKEERERNLYRGRSYMSSSCKVTATILIALIFLIPLAFALHAKEHYLPFMVLWLFTIVLSPFILLVVNESLKNWRNKLEDSGQDITTPQKLFVFILTIMLLLLLVMLLLIMIDLKMLII